MNDLLDMFDISWDPVTLYSKKIHCLLYADDLILFSETEKGLQNCLNKLYDYCQDWKLNININRSKIMVFNNSGKKVNNHFYIDKDLLQSVNSYNNVGVEISINGSLVYTIMRLCGN